MKFSDYNISKDIKEQLAVLGFNKPTDIQFKAIQHILDGEDVMAIAQTGTGKTAAFAIPTLDKIHRSKMKYKKSGIRCLVMVPTRELAKQISKVYQDIGAKTNVKTFGLFGGVEQEQQIRTLNNGIDILVTTPGRMFDLISQGAIDITGIQFLVLDEADKMLNLGFKKEMNQIFEMLPKLRQNLLFSATLSKDLEGIHKLVLMYPEIIKIDVEGHEEFVLRGAVKTLANNNYPKILFESWSERQEQNNIPSIQIRKRLFDFLESLGYKIIQIQGGTDDMFLAEKE